MKRFAKKFYLILFILIVGFNNHGLAKIIYVNQAPPTNNNNGKYWISTYKSLQSALDAAVSGDQIWVAKGTYYPSKAYNLTNSPRYYHFEMKTGVAIYGGFAGNETAVDQRTAFGLGETNETILSGDIGTLGDNSDNCYHVIFNPNGLISSAMLDGFTVSGGNADGPNLHNSGGGMYNYGSSPTLSNITLTSNKASNGGGMANTLSSPKLTRFKFFSNYATFGGGMFNMQSSPIITNALFISNTASSSGGAIYFNNSSSPVLNNVTFTLNNASSYGGGISSNNSKLTLNNCIIWDNTAVEFGYQISIDYSNVALNHSCYSNVGYDVFNDGGTLKATNNNITTNPQFVNAGNGNYQLSKGSPCIDAGNNSYNSETYDIRGKGFLRKTSGTNHTQTGTIDMGAYEFVGNATIYVNASANGSNNGTNWANAFKSLHSALNIAIPGDQIWVAKGTYKPSSAYDLTESGDRDFHFRMIDNVAIYGGFAGTETEVDDRTSFASGEANETILSGDIGTEGDNSDNCYHVFYNPVPISSTAILNGFTITGGNANNVYPHNIGGGMFNSESSPTLVNTFLLSNAAESGGGIANMQSSPSLTNVIIAGNTVSNLGGGIINFNNSSPVLNNVTLTANTAKNGGAIAQVFSSGSTINNSILWGNTAQNGSQFYNGSESPDIVLNNSCYNNSTSSCFEINLTTNNSITSDPLFVDPANNIYQLLPTSPCIDAGNNSYNSLAYDIRGKGFPRRLSKNNASIPGNIDIGAYEYNATEENSKKKIYVNINAVGKNDGTSWTDAYTSFQTALDNALKGDTIWVAKGTYKPSSAYDLTIAGDRDFHFRMVNGVQIYGGFAGTETHINQRTTFAYGEANETILSGDIGTEGDNSDNCYHVFFHPNGLALSNKSILDGFTISGGNANAYDSPHNCGGGMYNSNASPTLVNVYFVSNISSSHGGGMYNATSSNPQLSHVTFALNESLRGAGMANLSLSAARLTDVIFTSNKSRLIGAGMYNFNSSPILNNVRITSNESKTEYGSTGGGGMYNEASSPILSNVIINSNIADVGGAMYNTYLSYPVLTNVTIASNTASNSAGGIYNSYSSPVMTNVLITLNVAGNTGGAIVDLSSDRNPILKNVTISLNKATNANAKGGGVFSNGGKTTYENCIIWGNTAKTGNQFYLMINANATLNYSCFANSTNDVYLDASTITATNNNITTDPLFVNAADGDCRLVNNSPCVNTGRNSYNTTSTDVRGQTRIQNTTIDMGAYENTSGIDPVCTNPTNGGEISSDQFVCVGSAPNSLTSKIKPSGFNSTLEYKWQFSFTSASSGFEDIPEYDETLEIAEIPVAGSYWFRRMAKAACMANDWSGAAFSNVLVITAGVPSAPTITDGSNTYTYDGTAKTALAAVASDETIDWYDAETNGNSVSAPSGTNAGTYKAYAETRNIAMGCKSSGRTPVTLTINTAAVTVTPLANQSKVYGDADPVFTYSVTPALTGNDAFTGALSREPGESTNTYAFTTGSLSAGNNYTISLASGNFTIAPKPVTVTPDANQSKVYGDSDPAFTYTLSPSLVGDDKITGALDRTPGENIGTYAFSVGLLNAGSNYTVTFADAGFTIVPKPITITPDSKSKDYGDTDPVFTYSSTPLLSGDYITGTPAREAGENAGTYKMTVGTLNAGNNYQLTVTDIDFTINAKTIYVFVDVSKSKVYSDADPELTFTTIPDLIAGDQFTGALSRTPGENAGLYAIEAGTLTAGSNYSIDFTNAVFEIKAKQLSISDPVLTAAKQYDGTTIALVTPGTLSGILASDEGNITASAIANYDDAEIGTNKTITVTYLLDGPASGNYLVPANYIANNGIIIDRITIAGLQAPQSGCEGGSLNIQYDILSGTPAQYQILFDNAAIAAGFGNISYTAAPASNGSAIISIDVPEGLPHGTYAAQLQLRSASGSESDLYPFSFTVDLSSDYLVDKFDDVILCDNSSNLFAAYQWFKNEALINGATNQAYCDPIGLSGTYYVQVVTTDGKTLKTCPASYTALKAAKALINVFPNPVQAGQTFTIEVTDMQQDDLKGAVLHIFDSRGTEVYHSKQVKELNDVSLSNKRGNYIIRIDTATGKTLTGRLSIL